MPDVLGPTRDDLTDYLGTLRQIRQQMATSPPPRPSPALDRLSLMVYGFQPLQQEFLDVHNVADSRPNAPGWDWRIGNLSTTRNPGYGARLEYLPESWKLGPVQGGVNLDVFHQEPTIPAQRATGGTRQYSQDLDGAMLDFTARLPLGNGWTPYLGAGAGVVRTQQGDQFGYSPPAVNLGAQAMIGVEKELADRWALALELKRLENAVTPHDQQGGYRGHFNQTSGLVGLKYKFGGGK